jgi:hypothetical protein
MMLLPVVARSTKAEIILSEVEGKQSSMPLVSGIMKDEN